MDGNQQPILRIGTCFADHRGDQSLNENVQIPPNAKKRLVCAVSEKKVRSGKGSTAFINKQMICGQAFTIKNAAANCKSSKMEMFQSTVSDK